MQALIEVVLPVFLVLGFGYIAVRRGWFSDEGSDALMSFTQRFAIPCLLFMAMVNLDLGTNFDWRLIGPFYVSALLSFITAAIAAHRLFNRTPEEAIAIGFGALFSNSVLLGLPITERAYGPDALAANYVIVALHAPFCYGVGVTVMEFVQNRGKGPVVIARRVGTIVFRNALLMAIGLGLLWNLLNLPLPQVAADGISLLASAALPAALFALGGVLARYKPEGDLATALMVCACSLLLHPALTWGLGTATGLGTDSFRSAVLTAAMAPGVNTYIFANMYGLARRVAATVVLAGTGFSVLTVWLWLILLP